MDTKITSIASIKSRIALLILIVSSVPSAFAAFVADEGNKLLLPDIFSDHMVLQRGQPVNIWGVANSGEEVEILFRDSRFNTKADSLGKWIIALPSMAAGGPYEMVVKSGAANKTINDIFVGEVWLAAGQSNMAFRFKFSDEDAKAEALATLGDLDIRTYEVAKIVSGGKLLNEENTPWAAATPADVGEWSAVALYFAQALHLEEGVVVGIINCSQGSSTIEAWMSTAAIEDTEASGYVLMEKFGDIRRHYRNPSVLYQSMLSKVIPYTLKGVLWYQGESNGGEAASYEILLTALIKSWREVWEQELPFLFAQLPAYEPPNDETGNAWARFRAAQAEVDKTVPGTGMVVLIDVGEKDNIHPSDKKVVGDRFANLARSQVYGAAVAYAGPSIKQIEYRGKVAIISFHFSESGLVVKGETVQGFSVKGEDGIWKAANAEVMGNGIIVHHPEAQTIVGVRYAWANAPDVNLYNGKNYPAVPFIVEAVHP
jgi:sialate O-acetylesterase